ncbi:MAG: hypothetical protein KTR16_12910 [Acidiferrobacterales bacterium]|nr:hypothetical protein [Acidiferrobacterales bacterium]
MSTQFWITLTSALVLFAIAIVAVQIFKSGLIRDLRARSLRRKIVPLVQSMLPMIVEQARVVEATQLGGNYDLMRGRATLEALHQRSKPLFDEERTTIAQFLQSLSRLTPQFDQQEVVRVDLENTVLLGQRVVHELTEIGL